MDHRLTAATPSLTKDRVVVYAITISVAAHLLAAVVVGQTWAARLSRPAISSVPKFIKVDLVEEPRPEQKPIKVSVPKIEPKPTQPEPIKIRHLAPVAARESAPDTSVRPARNSAAPERVAALPGSPGSALSQGSTSENGEVPERSTGGSTPVGWVPGSGSGSGQGAGGGPGVAAPDPPKHPVDDGPGTKPAPAPPPPKVVSLVVCAASGMLPGRYCEKKVARSFVEGSEPSRVCTECKEPFTSTLADRAEPVLIRDAKPVIPSSLEEGLSVSVTVVFTIDERGNVTDVQVTKSSGNKLIDRAIAEAVSKRKYEPAIQGGIPRSVKRSKTYSVNT